MQEVSMWDWLPWFFSPVIVKPILAVLTSISTLVVAVATVVNVWVSKGMMRASMSSADAAKASSDAAIRSADISEKSAQVTSLAFEASHRPYFAVEHIEADALDIPDKGAIKVTFKNYGSVPLRCGAYSIRATTSDLLAAPRSVHVQEFPPVASTVVLPGEQSIIRCGLDESWLYELILSGAADLEIATRIPYVSVATGKEYLYSGLHRFNSAVGQFEMQESSMD